MRVINDDVIAPGHGFGMHGHSDMEVVTYVLEGALAHKDSLGNGATILPGDVQRISAGTGIRHSEFNHDLSSSTHLLQIWMLPSEAGIRPSYEQKHFTESDKRGQLRLVASPDVRYGSVQITADARLSMGLFDGHERGDGVESLA